MQDWIALGIGLGVALVGFAVYGILLIGKSIAPAVGGEEADTSR